jgi:hypothetical protein
MGEFSEIMQAVSRSLLKMPQKDYSASESSPKVGTKPTRKVNNIDTKNSPPRKMPGAVGNEEAKMARKGGMITRSGRVKLHRGEIVARKAGRSKTRGGSR